MLRRLSIHNYALIDHIEWSCSGGWTVLTGETGSGKSILLGALGLILGDRAEGVDPFRQEKCIVEAEFTPSPAARALLGPLDEPDGCIIRRSIAPGGRSRAYVNDEPVKLQFLKTLAPLLVDLHGQRDGQRLHASEGLLHAIDAFSEECGALSTKWRERYAQWASSQREWSRLEAMGGLPEADADYLKFQLAELEAIDLDDPELRTLDERLSRLEHAQDIRFALDSTANALGGEGNVLEQLRQVELWLDRIAAVHGEAALMRDRIRSCRIELEDAARESESLAEDLELDPAALAAAEADRDRLNRLLDKHRAADIEALSAHQTTMRDRLEEARRRDERIRTLKAETAAHRKALDELGLKLDDARRKAGAALSDSIVAHLAHLKLASARIGFEWTPTPTPEAAGPCRVSMAFSANPGMDMQPVDKVASGGERSRVMLALKASLAAHLEVPTLILDEIDTGVSGEVAARMADLIAAIAKGAQVITISHLPQVAGKADHHYRVSKEERDGRAYTGLTLLDEDARIEELAGMLSGDVVGEAARAQARALMA